MTLALSAPARRVSWPAMTIIIIGNLIVQLFLEFRSIPLGSAVSVVMLAISSIAILLYMRVLRRAEAVRA